ncbi:odorant receptor 94a-like [Hylaeus volcanicus]|uniref:odorant receptor 94a-like n=1 Tax=Hylaeus volcanicus TaxID=313075 RepID=UPI0023B814E9|nr:odorant receptor 94a-like [Hylaeus volcanicus]
MLHSFLLSTILDLVFNVDNQNDFSDNVYLTLEVFAACWKMSSLKMYHENYAFLMDTLEREPLAPANADEIEIRTRFDKIAQRNTKTYMLSLVACVGSMLATSIFTDVKTRKLSYRTWIPYDYSSSLWFTITYVYLVICMATVAVMNVSSDSLFSGLLLHTYSLFEILGHRLKTIINYRNDSVKQCVRLHIHIYRFAMMVNEQFKSIILIQFLVSTLIFCIELYRMTQRSVDSKYIEMVVYGTCSLMQILYYCWYGNEVQEKSLTIPEMIIDSNWESLDTDSKKTLLMIMKRATMPIEFSSFHIASMNLASFMALFKTSYSAYNVLQRSEE